MILAPATMAKEKDPKEAARKCLEEVKLDPDSYRVGHTKARVHVNPSARLFYEFIVHPQPFEHLSKVEHVFAP